MTELILGQCNLGCARGSEIPECLSARFNLDLPIELQLSDIDVR